MRPQKPRPRVTAARCNTGQFASGSKVTGAGDKSNYCRSSPSTWGRLQSEIFSNVTFNNKRTSIQSLLAILRVWRFLQYLVAAVWRRRCSVFGGTTLFLCRLRMT